MSGPYEIHSRPIPWKFETNTQGANRAHDAWCHLQQVQVTLGSFLGTMKYGVRGLDINGKWVDVSKLFTDNRHVFDAGYEWNIHDKLRIGRDMMEWSFYAETLPSDWWENAPYNMEIFRAEDGEGTGLVSVVQYRYTPVSVNVGTEFGSVETFEYGRNVADGGPDAYSGNGIPLTYTDMRR